MSAAMSAIMEGGAAGAVPPSKRTTPRATPPSVVISAMPVTSSPVTVICDVTTSGMAMPAVSPLRRSSRDPSLVR